MTIAEFCQFADLEVGFKEGEGDMSIDDFTACCFLEAKTMPNGYKMRLMVDFGYQNAREILEALEKEAA